MTTLKLSWPMTIKPTARDTAYNHYVARYNRGLRAKAAWSSGTVLPLFIGNVKDSRGRHVPVYEA